MQKHSNIILHSAVISIFNFCKMARNLASLIFISSCIQNIFTFIEKKAQHFHFQKTFYTDTTISLLSNLLRIPWLYHFYENAEFSKQIQLKIIFCFRIKWQQRVEKEINSEHSKNNCIHYLLNLKDTFYKLVYWIWRWSMPLIKRSQVSNLWGKFIRVLEASCNLLKSYLTLPENGNQFSK